MLFNSYEFIFAFLPTVLAVFFLIGRYGQLRLAVGWLVLASLFFYGWWNPSYLGLIITSVLFNYSVGIGLGRGAGRRWHKPLLVLGITANLGLLGYYKYANFFLENLNRLASVDYHLGTIILPLAISFFTFQQITYLVDAYRGETREYDFLQYCLFVTFFPQLIAGPIVHHKEMLPQFSHLAIYRPDAGNLSVGLSFFFMGLFKKAVLADGAAVYATPVFGAAAMGESPTFFIAWGGALAYTCQLYFDFSGYSDMAIGLARLFGIRLPLNFNSPYKAATIADFWRRWHMTLSRFLRDYVYIALGGNRRGRVRRHANLLLTMLLGGLWHGAGWTFVFWGLLHGTYLIICHLWQALRPLPAMPIWSARLLTFLCVVVSWVFFRAADFETALRILSGMVGLNGVTLPSAIGYRLGMAQPVLESMGVAYSLGGGRQFVLTYLWVGGLLAIAFWCPNTQQILRRYRPALDFKPTTPVTKRLCWRPSPAWGMVMGCATVMGILALSQVSEFLYFQF